MWDDIIIKKEDSNLEKLSSAYTLLGTSEFHISENSSAFWISGNFLGIGMTIYKDTKEGIKLGKLIKVKELKKEEIETFLYKILFTKAEIPKILDAIKSVKEYSFQRGKRAKSKEIREVLNI